MNGVKKLLEALESPVSLWITLQFYLVAQGIAKLLKVERDMAFILRSPVHQLMFLWCVPCTISMFSTPVTTMVGSPCLATFCLAIMPGLSKNDKRGQVA